MESKIIPLFPEDAQWLANLRVGDPVERWLAGAIPMALKVTESRRDQLICGLWTFDRATGAEIDEELGWGPQLTGSYIRPPSH